MSVLTGSVMWSMTVSAPTGYLVCNGAEIDAATYPRLHTHLTNAGNPFGTSNGNPKIPDLITDNRFIVNQSVKEFCNLLRWKESGKITTTTGIIIGYPGIRIG